MNETSHTIHIDAPPDAVWRATVDVDAWPAFVPTMKRIERVGTRAFGLGSSARITPRGFVSARWTVTEFDDGRSFAWEAGMLPGLHVVARHAVEPEAGGTRLTLTLRTSGPTAALLKPVLRPTFRRNLREEAAAFKTRCEQSP